MRIKNATVRSAGIVTAACAASLVLSVMPAHADSVQSSGASVTSTGSLGNHAAPGGAVPRSQAIARAKVWVEEQVPYSTNGLMSPYSWWADSRTGGRYRQDCSGFVSMAWQLNSSRTTLTLPDVSSQISKWDLQPGDALNSNDHVILFAGWRDKAAGTFNYYQESSRSRPTNYNTDGNLYASSLASHPTSSYSALRYKNITDTPPVSDASKVHLEIVGADGGMWNTDGDYAAGEWSGSWASLGGTGLKALASAVTGNTMHVYAIGSTGRVYTKDANYSTGQWSTDWAEVPGNIQGATALTASVTGNKVHLEVIGADGAMWNTDGDYAAGEWSGSWASLGGTGLKALASAVTGNTMHVYAVGSTGRVFTKDANYSTGQWSTDWAEVPGNIQGATALTASVTGNKVHLEVIGADGAMWNTDGDYAAGEWTGSWASLGGTGLKALASAVTGNTMHVYAVGSTGRVYTKDANYSTGQWSTDWAEIPGNGAGATALTASTTP
ncbi:hypothetical protein ACGFNX_19465 [Streptomyces sp. NPDC048723]|uniref:hypothetical protein n=1 Tax=Streptomyces sp. NPDC048723 TaxID=3365589 RepID=UPI0037119744